MNVLIILQGPAYGDERAYNGLRHAGSLAQLDGVAVRIFCFGDAVGCAIAGQKLPDGYYHLDRMLTSAARHGAEIGLGDIDLRASPRSADTSIRSCLCLRRGSRVGNLYEGACWVFSVCRAAVLCRPDGVW